MVHHFLIIWFNSKCIVAFSTFFSRIEPAHAFVQNSLFHYKQANLCMMILSGNTLFIAAIVFLIVWQSVIFHVFYKRVVALYEYVYSG